MNYLRVSIAFMLGWLAPKAFQAFHASRRLWLAIASAVASLIILLALGGRSRRAIRNDRRQQEIEPSVERRVGERRQMVGSN